MVKRQYSKYIRKYGLILASGMAAAFVLFILYKVLKNGSITVSAASVLKILLAGAAVSGLICISLQAAKWTFRQRFSPDFNRKELITAILLTLILFACFIPVFSDYIYGTFPITYGVTSDEIAGYDSDAVSDVGEIVNGTTVSQTFTLTGSYIVSVTLMGGTFGRNNTGTLCIELKNDETGEIMETWYKPAAEIVDKGNFALYLNAFDYPELYNRRLRVDISSYDSEPGDAVTLYYSTDDRYEGGTLTINGTEMEGALVMISGILWNQGSQEKTKIWLSIFQAAIAWGIVLFLIRRSMKTQAGRTAEK